MAAPFRLPSSWGCLQDFPSLDSPHPQPGFNVGHVAAALGHSIRHLRYVELQQLQTQQLGGLQAQQQAAQGSQTAQQQQKLPPRQKPREQDAELGTAGKGSIAAPCDKGRAAKGSNSTAADGSNSSSGMGKAGGNTSQQRRASDATQETASAARSRTANSAAAKANATAAAESSRARAPAAAGAGDGGGGGAKTGAVRAAGGRTLQAAAGSEKVQSPTPLTGVKLQVRRATHWDANT